MANQDAAVVDTIEDYSKMKVVELKKLLKERGLAQSGTKDELVERLKQANEAAEKKLLGETAEESGETGAAPIDEDLENEIMNDESKVSSTAAKPGDKRKVENGKDEPAADPSAQKAAEAGENKENKTGDAVEADGDKTESSEPAKKIIKLSAITPDQKKELRAKKFGLTEEEKKEARAKRFGITPQAKSNSVKPSLTTVKNSGAAKPSDELLKKRAERFGMLGNKTLTPEEVEKRKKRAERFGAKPAQTVEEVKK